MYIDGKRLNLHYNSIEHQKDSDLENEDANKQMQPTQKPLRDFRPADLNR